MQEDAAVHFTAPQRMGNPFLYTNAYAGTVAYFAPSRYRTLCSHWAPPRTRQKERP